MLSLQRGQLHRYRDELECTALSNGKLLGGYVALGQALAFANESQGDGTPHGHGLKTQSWDLNVSLVCGFDRSDRMQGGKEKRRRREFPNIYNIPSYTFIYLDLPLYSLIYLQISPNTFIYAHIPKGSMTV